MAAIPNPAAASLTRVPLRCALTPPQVLTALRGRELPFALSGSWAGGGAIIGSEPLAVADDGDDPFAVLDDLPRLSARDHGHPDAVGGGWFGWLGYRLGARIEQLPAGPPRPVPLPEFHLAYYDNVLRLDPAGRWWFEALVSERRRAALRARLDALREMRREPPPAAPARRLCTA